MPPKDFINRIIARVRLSLGANGPVIETPMSGDGAFEFSNVPPGEYLAAVIGVLATQFKPTTVVVGEQNLSGLIVPMPVQTAVYPRVTAIDENGKVIPGFEPGSGLEYRSEKGAGGGGKLLLHPGEYSMYITKLPPGFAVRSFTYRGIDLVRMPLKVGESMTPIDIEITLERLH